MGTREDGKKFIAESKAAQLTHERDRAQMLLESARGMADKRRERLSRIEQALQQAVAGSYNCTGAQLAQMILRDHFPKLPPGYGESD